MRDPIRNHFLNLPCQMANVLNQRFSPFAQKIDSLRQGVEGSRIMHEPMLK